METTVDWRRFAGSLIYLGVGLSMVFLFAASVEHTRWDEKLKVAGIYDSPDAYSVAANRTFDFLVFSGASIVLAIIGLLLLLSTSRPDDVAPTRLSNIRETIPQHPTSTEPKM